MAALWAFFKQKSPAVRLQSLAILWFGAESNRRHMDFQSIALPTELPNQNRSANLGQKDEQPIQRENDYTDREHSPVIVVFTNDLCNYY